MKQGRNRPAAALGPGRADRLGVTPEPGGVNVAVFSDHASAIHLCLFDASGRRETARLALPERTGSVWHGFVPGLRPGQLYGLRAEGPWAPEQGHRFNPAKLLMDPYATGFSGEFGDRALLTGHDEARGDLVPCPRDSAPALPKCVVTRPLPPVPEGERPRRAWGETLIYEAHPKGLTKLWPGLPESQRGSFAGIAADPVIGHLTALGVTAVELLPVQAFLDDRFLLDRGLSNYWGYNTHGFFAPHARYGGPAGFREMVRRLHAAGIEVILDVVYNHTAEGNELGPTLSFRGLDNASWYRLMPGAPRFFVNDTGCGNTLNLSHPMVLRMVLDSLRWWVTAMGVDGFRFDLATSLAREDHGFDPRGGFLDALMQDPVLSGVKLIAEPWDIGPGGYRLGGFPAPFAEWNDGFRDSTRRFWKGEPHSAQDFAGRLLGSAVPFDRGGRPAWSSVNAVACHDGFTLADLATYSEKHNEANGEGNRDGHHGNFSDNCGAEGPTDDPVIRARRARRCRNLAASVFLAQGTPMLRAGDETLQSQGGNNNAYCQDNAISWIDWARGDAAFLGFVRRLAAFRRAHPCLRQSRFLHGRTRAADGAADVAWQDPQGGPVNWRDPGLDGFCLVLRMAAETPPGRGDGDMLCLVFNSAPRPLIATLPEPPEGTLWQRALDTAAPAAPDLPCAPGPQTVAAQSIAAFSLTGAA